MALTMEDMQAIRGIFKEELKTELDPLKGELRTVKEDLETVKEELRTVKEDLETVKQKITTLELTLENETNHNIQLLAENHINLIDKLNQAIRVSDKTLLYEVQVSGLKSRVESLEREVAELKSRIA